MATEYTRARMREAVQHIEDWLEHLGPTLPDALVFVAVTESEGDNAEVECFLVGDPEVVLQAVEVAFEHASSTTTTVDGVRIPAGEGR